MKEILLKYGIPEEIGCAIMMLYKNIRLMVRSPDEIHHNLKSQLGTYS